MSKGNERILSEVPVIVLLEELNNKIIYTECQVLDAMTAARQDERDRIREIVQDQMNRLECDENPDSPANIAYSALYELLKLIQ